MYVENIFMASNVNVTFCSFNLFDRGCFALEMEKWPVQAAADAHVILHHAAYNPEAVHFARISLA